MVLAIDIGNTNIVIGGFEKDELLFTARVSTNVKRTEDEYSVDFRHILSLHGVTAENITGAIISSVVPPLNTVIKNAVKFIYGVTPLIVGPGVKTGVNIKCDSPSTVGTDIICSCVAVHKKYGDPAVIIDLGTATKLTVVDKNGTFTGVSIAPGVMMGLNALADNTAQLPKVSLDEPMVSAIGKNTADSMRSGVIFGHAAMIDGMIDRISSETGMEYPVYATGGMAGFITVHCMHKITVDDDLVLKGLNIIYSKNN